MKAKINMLANLRQEIEDHLEKSPPTTEFQRGYLYCILLRYGELANDPKVCRQEFFRRAEQMTLSQSKHERSARRTSRAAR